MSKEKWERRYAEREDAPGEPNPVFVEEVEGLPPGRALDLAAGDGRHAIYLARRGWQVTAVDFSQTALERGERFAAAAGIGSGAEKKGPQPGVPGVGEGGAIEWVQGDLTEYSPPPGRFDLVTIMFLHIPWEEMKSVLRRAKQAPAAGGIFLLMGHHRDNLGRGTGGPQDPGVLYTENDVTGVLSELEILRAEAIERRPEHAGEATAEPGALALDCLVRARRR